MNEEMFYPRRSFSFPPKYTEFKDAKVVVLPIPYDSTVDWRAGTREGPNAIIDASHFLEQYDHELGCYIHDVGIHTLPELIPSMKGPEETVERVYTATKDILDKGKFVVMLGGEHSLTTGAVRAYRERFKNLSVLQLDAHADLRDEYEDTKFNHACVMRRVHEYCPIVQVGIRSMGIDDGVGTFASAGAPVDGAVVRDRQHDDLGVLEFGVFGRERETASRIEHFFVHIVLTV